jgi:hypothetical protein
VDPTRPGKSIGAKLARTLVEQFSGERSPKLEGAYPAASRHQVFVLSDDRVVDVFLKSARLYRSAEEFHADVSAR